MRRPDKGDFLHEIESAKSRQERNFFIFWCCYFGLMILCAILYAAV